MKKTIFATLLAGLVFAGGFAAAQASETFADEADGPELFSYDVSGQDANEPNDSSENATTLLENEKKSFTLHAVEDEDWFRIVSDTEGAAIKIKITGFDSSVYGSLRVNVFSKEELDGGKTDSFWSASASDDFESYCKLGAAGEYFIRLSLYSNGKAILKELELSYELLLPDGNENNDTWQSAAELTENVNAVYTLPAGNDVDWFKFTISSPGDAAKLIFSDFNYTVSPISAYLYSGSELEKGNEKALWSKTNFKLNTEINYKLNEPGDYYIKILPYSASFSTSIQKPLKLRYEIIGPDENELNDSYEQATEFGYEKPAYFTLNGINDIDWFYFETTEQNEMIYLNIDGFESDYTNKIRYEVRAAEGKSYGFALYSDSVNIYHKKAMMLQSVGKYYVKIWDDSDTLSVENRLSLSIEKGVSDENEPNDSWESAAPIEEGRPVYFNMPAHTDIDWFKFTTTKKNQTVDLSFALPSGRWIDAALFTAEKLNAYGASASAEKTWPKSYSARDIDGSEKTLFRYMLAEPGEYYLKLSPYWYSSDATTTTFEALAELNLSLIEPDENEENDSWKSATALAEDEHINFTLPAENDVDFFRINVPKDNMSIKLNLNLPEYGKVEIRLMPLEGFRRYGDNGQTLYSVGYVGSGTYRYMFETAGEYFIKVSPGNEKNSSFYYSSRYWVFDDLAELSFSLIEGDEYERNNSWESAGVLNEGVPSSFNLPTPNDTDWFKFVSAVPGQTVDFEIEWPDSAKPADIRIYSGAELREKGERESTYVKQWSNAYDIIGEIAGNGEHFYRCVLTEADDYYIRLTTRRDDGVFEEFASIKYSFVAADTGEPNDSIKTATLLSEGISRNFTLPAFNDVDYFKINVPKDNQTLEISLDVPEGGSVTTDIYKGNGSVLRGFGNSAGITRGNVNSDTSRHQKTHRYMLSEAGDYYIRLGVYTYDSSMPGDRKYIFDSPATITAKLIEPDAHERNNESSNATELGSWQVVNFSLPASNDEDWFHIGSLTAGDSVSLYVGNVRNGYVRGYLYYIPSGPSDGSAKSVNGGIYSSAGAEETKNASNSWKITADGDYYFRLYGECLSNMWLRYAASRADIAVTGISEISNGDSSIFEGKSLQLYANVLPANATNQKLLWSSSDEAVAIVDANGLVAGVSAGEANIDVSTEDGGYVSSIKLSVAEAIPVSGVSLSGKDPSKRGESEESHKPLALGTAIQLYAKIEPENATESGVEWSSSDESVLLVNSYGKAYAQGAGSAVITAKSVDGGFEAHFWIDVPNESNPVKAVKLSMNAATIYMGEDGLDLSAQVVPSYATNTAVEWISSNESVASVDENGHVSAVGKGYAVISARAAENTAIYGSCTVAVLGERVRVSEISFENDTLKVGLYGTVSLNPIISPSNATDQDVSWVSSNKTVATVSRNGLVSTLNIGTAVITAVTADGEKTASVTVKVSANAELGDVNNDGDIDAGDALMILRNSVGLILLSDAQKAVADVNGDGDIDAGDAVLLLRYDAGLIEEFPAGKR